MPTFERWGKTVTGHVCTVNLLMMQCSKNYKQLLINRSNLPLIYTTGMDRDRYKKIHSWLKR